MPEVYDHCIQGLLHTKSTGVGGNRLSHAPAKTSPYAREFASCLESACETLFAAERKPHRFRFHCQSQCSHFRCCFQDWIRWSA